VRRSLFSAALVLFLLPAAFAQRGGGHPGGGRAGVAIGRPRSAGARHVGLTGRGPMMQSRGRHLGGFRPGGRRIGRVDHHRFHRGFRSRGYPWVYYGYYGDPWLYDDYGDFSDDQSSYSDSASYDQNGYLLQEEIDRLREEVSGLRAQQDWRSKPAAPAQAEPEAPLKAEIHAETVLVFRDKHTQEVQNYAIVGKTIWVFDEARASKFPLADLDIPATTKANEDRGIDFKTPG
jgi:hypothetical protein